MTQNFIHVTLHSCYVWFRNTVKPFGEIYYLEKSKNSWPTGLLNTPEYGKRQTLIGSKSVSANTKPVI